MLPAVPGWFVSADRPVRSELIFVTGSDPAGSTEVVAARLWRRGLGRYLVCVGRPVAWHVLGEQAMAAHLRALGIPASRVMTLDIPFADAPDSGTMREENRWVRAYMLRRGFHTAIVISPALQSRRRSFFLRTWRRSSLIVHVYPVADPGFRAGGWWHRKTDTKIVVSEALGWLMLPFGG